METKLIMLAFALVLLVVAPPGGNAQFGLFNPPAKPAAPGAGKSFSDVICSDRDLSTLCQLVRTANKDPSVAELFDPTLTATVFAPTNSAFEETQRRITSTLGVPSVSDLQRNPAVAAKLLGAHVVVGQSVPFEQLKDGLKFKSAEGSTLTVSTGYVYGVYIKGPTNTVRVSGTQGQYDIPAARGLIHKVNQVIVPKRS